MRLTDPAGRIGHAHMTIGDSAFMLADEYPEFGAVGPATLGGTPITLHLEVADPDAAAQRAVDAGATLLRPVQDSFTATAQAWSPIRSATNGACRRGPRR